MKSANRSCLRLLAFCLTTSSIAGLAVALLLATATLAVATAPPNESNESASSLNESQATAATTAISGVVTDSYCGARHSRNSGKTSEECTRDCVRNGAKYVLVNGENIYTLSGNQTAIGKVAGQRAQLHGMLDGGNLRVVSIATASE